MILSPEERAEIIADIEAQGGARVRPPSGMGATAMQAGFDELFRRAAEGDPQAIYKNPSESWGSAAERWANRRR
jgi:hypothetical protein